MRKGFTLVELMVTVGLMAMLATLATAGYYAASRGMADRGARQNVVSFLRLAAQRAVIDDLPVVVFISDRTLTKEADDGSTSAEAVGVMTAVRMAGRISAIGNGGEIVDEFADWGAAFPNNGNSNDGQTMRLYRLVYGGGASACLSYVTPYAAKAKLAADEAMLVSGISVGSSSSSSRIKFLDGIDGVTSFECDYVQAPNYGFKVVSGNSSWVVGDAYGFEIAELQLPKGYTFSASIENNVGRKDVGSPIWFLPSEAGLSDEIAPMSGGNVQLYALRPGKTTPQSVGKSISYSDLKD